MANVINVVKRKFAGREGFADEDLGREAAEEQIKYETVRVVSDIFFVAEEKVGKDVENALFAEYCRLFAVLMRDKRNGFDRNFHAKKLALVYVDEILDKLEYCVGMIDKRCARIKEVTCASVMFAVGGKPCSSDEYNIMKQVLLIGDWK